MLPCENVTAFVLGTGPDLPADRLGRLEGYFTLGVNGLWRHGCTPTVSLWIDGGVYRQCPSHFDRTLCVCDRSVRTRPEQIGLEMKAGPLPRHLNPNRLYHLPNTGVVAALWAVSLGCCPVVLLGMGCLNDGRAPAQLGAMRAALDAAVAMDYRPRGACWPALWPWSGDPKEFDDNLRNYHVRPADTPALLQDLREFFA